MPIVLRGMTRGAAEAILAGERPEALVARAREASEVRRIVAHTPLDRPQSGRVVEKAGFAMLRETDDVDDVGNVLRVMEWELAL